MTQKLSSAAVFQKGLKYWEVISAEIISEGNYVDFFAGLKYTTAEKGITQDSK